MKLVKKKKLPAYMGMFLQEGWRDIFINLTQLHIFLLTIRMAWDKRQTLNSLSI